MHSDRLALLMEVGHPQIEPRPCVSHATLVAVLLKWCRGLHERVWLVRLVWNDSN